MRNARTGSVESVRTRTLHVPDITFHRAMCSCAGLRCTPGSDAGSCRVARSSVTTGIARSAARCEWGHAKIGGASRLRRLTRSGSQEGRERRPMVARMRQPLPQRGRSPAEARVRQGGFPHARVRHEPEAPDSPGSRRKSVRPHRVWHSTEPQPAGGDRYCSLKRAFYWCVHVCVCVVREDKQAHYPSPPAFGLGPSLSLSLFRISWPGGEPRKGGKGAGVGAGGSWRKG